MACKAEKQKVTRRENQQGEMKKKTHSKLKEGKETKNATAETKPHAEFQVS